MAAEQREVETDRQPGESRMPGLLWGVGFLLVLLIGGTSERFFFGRGLAEAIGALLLGGAIASGGIILARDRLMFWLCCALAGLMALQAVPLPPSVWSALPGREIVVALDTALGTAHWRPITLDWEALVPAVLFLVPCAGALVAATVHHAPRITWLLVSVGIAWALAVFISVLQAFGGLDLGYNQTAHEVFVTGFFFNHNHHAVFLVCSGLLTGALVLERGWPPSATIGIALATAVAVLLTASRSGLAVCLIAAGAVVMLTIRGKASLPGTERLSTTLLAVALGAVAVILVLSDGPLAALADRDALLDDRRFTIWTRSLDLLAIYWPVGSGLGTFAQVYAIHEPLDEMRPLFVNHAHNDLLEFAIETGLAGIVLLFCFIIWLCQRTLAVWVAQDRVSPIAKAALVVIWTLLAASLVEFPLRTVSLAALASLCIGLVAREGLSRK